DLLRLVLVDLQIDLLRLEPSGGAPIGRLSGVPVRRPPRRRPLGREHPYMEGLANEVSRTGRRQPGPARPGAGYQRGTRGMPAAEWPFTTEPGGELPPWRSPGESLRAL